MGRPMKITSKRFLCNIDGFLSVQKSLENAKKWANWFIGTETMIHATSWDTWEILSLVDEGPLGSIIEITENNMEQVNSVYNEGHGQSEMPVKELVLKFVDCSGGDFTLTDREGNTYLYSRKKGYRERHLTKQREMPSSQAQYGIVRGRLYSCGYTTDGKRRTRICDVYCSKSKTDHNTVSKEKGIIEWEELLN